MIYNFYVLVSENDPENIRYVGVTTRKVSERFSLHKYCATHPEHRVLPVHKWMFSKYLEGGKIIAKKIDECSEIEWEEKEQYWITYYKNKGFKLMNLDKGGKGVNLKEKRSKESITRSIEGHEKAIIALNKDGSFYKEYQSIKQATEDMGLSSKSAISNVLNGRSKSSKGYLWIYKENYDSNKQYAYTPSNRRIKVYAFNYEGTLIITYPYIRIFNEMEGFSENGVRNAITNKCSYHNLYWSTSESIDIDEYKFPYQFKIDNTYFTTQSELAKFLGISSSHLCTLLKGKDFLELNNYKIERIVN